MPVFLRSAEEADIPQMAAIRAREWGTEPYWTKRIAAYLSGEQSPQQALPARAAFVAIDEAEIVGFVAGHRTRRLGCDGELEWINVVVDRRSGGISYQLMAMMSAWFVEQTALRICVDVDPKNTAARKFYLRCGAQPLNDHWMVWEDARVMGTRMSKQ
jgi:RimJ/RimL family protein N-acetyltransferase